VVWLLAGRAGGFRLSGSRDTEQRGETEQQGEQGGGWFHDFPHIYFRFVI
jgi:hypothetical protein